ncbi:MAG: hypothetical protein ACRDQ9_20280 [Pseudonocardiaceae bacterium]
MRQDGYDGHDVAEIILDPHVTGGCVIIFDEVGARVLFEVLGEWFR